MSKINELIALQARALSLLTTGHALADRIAVGDCDDADIERAEEIADEAREIKLKMQIVRAELEKLETKPMVN